MLNLKRPLVIFDLETTGVDVTLDRILQIACLKINPDGSRESKDMLLNPGIPIPEGASEVHGIYDKDVKDCPPFWKISKALFSWLSGCDLGGFNSNDFDIPLLNVEFDRCKILWPEEGTAFVDAYQIECKVNERTLSATYERYMNEELSGAHDASVDVDATAEVLFSQLAAHELPKTVEELQSFCVGDKERVDIAGKLYRKDGIVRYNIGKDAKDKPVKDDLSFGKWMLKQKFFTQDTLNHLKKEM